VALVSRQQERAGFPVETRLSLLETDVDRVESSVTGLRDELKAIRTILMGVLVSLCTGCILFTLNIVVGALHR
jgi:hypothetical protein